MKRTPILLALLLALVATACASEETTTPSPVPSFDLDGDPELTARFPATVAGEPLQLQSLGGDAFAAAGPDPVFDDFLAAIGADATDVSVAFGGVLIGEETLTAGAFRVRGASEDELEREFISASEEAGEVPELTEETIGGKDVWTAVDESGETDTRVFVYTSGDTLYFLTGPLEFAAELLEALP